MMKYEEFICFPRNIISLPIFNLLIIENTFLQHFTTLGNVGLLSFASIVLLPFVSGDALTNRCPKENPYPFRNETYCCSRPVDFEWQKDGYCYGRTQKCTYSKGCVNCKCNL